MCKTKITVKKLVSAMFVISTVPTVILITSCSVPYNPLNIKGQDLYDIVDIRANTTETIVDSSNPYEYFDSLSEEQKDQEVFLTMYSFLYTKSLVWSDSNTAITSWNLKDGDSFYSLYKENRVAFGLSNVSYKLVDNELNNYNLSYLGVLNIQFTEDYDNGSETFNAGTVFEYVLQFDNATFTPKKTANKNIYYVLTLSSNDFDFGIASDIKNTIAISYISSEIGSLYNVNNVKLN